jgi:pimeloyl-ACP methyl ester carboxylesterase
MFAKADIQKALENVHRKIISVGVILVLSIFLAYGVTDSNAREPAKEQVTAHLRGGPITVYTYRPSGCSNPAFLFVFHGIGRNASMQIDSAQKLADRECMIVFAPLFDKEEFPVWRYQLGGVVKDRRPLPREQWAVWTVSDLVTWARVNEGRLDAPYYLFGHSAGAQFLSRVAAFGLPKDAKRIVIANPSTYVLPSTDEPAPFGLGGVFSEAEGEKQLRAYLQLPITIYVGEDDTGDKYLVQTRSAMRQGDNRLDRGQYTFDMAKSLAQAKGWDFGWRLVTVDGVGHSARRMLRSDDAMEAFDAAKEPEGVR